ncbi:MAG: Melittin resistance protein PqaB [Acidobacteriaceae bacterium]|nr:Melittin resistance protein PqaB [Acidobacteriaceae bacterium]
MLTRKLSSFELLIVVAVCLFLFFYGLGSFGLVGADEPRYAQIAREMLERNDYVTPTLNGVAWLEKPALYYWRAMFAFETFGVKDWAARLPSASFALGMIAVIFFHMRRFRPGAQLDAALITASCAAVIGFARGASTDMQLAAPFTVAMLGWYAWYETGKKIWLLDLYFFLAIATLAKGPVAPFLGGLVVLIFCALRRDMKAALRTLWPPGVLLFVAIVLPWFVAVQMRNPQFLHVFIFEHNLERFATNTFQHRQPFWYYVPVLLLSLIPWTFFAIPALLDAFRSSLKDWRLPKASDDRTLIDSFPEFLVIWTVIPILFFSLSQSKLPGYILPAIAPCTILTADFLQRRKSDPIHPLVIAAHAALAGLIVGLFLVFPYFFLQGLPLTVKAKLLAIGLSAGSFMLIYVTVRRTGPRFLRVVTIVPVIIILGFVLRVVAPSIDSFYSARPVAADLMAIGADGRPVAVYNAKRELRFGLGFYRNQKISSYNEKEIPVFQHLLIAKAGSRPEFEPLLKGRQFVPAGKFPAQHLEYYWVSAATASQAIATDPAPPASITKK